MDSRIMLRISSPVDLLLTLFEEHHLLGSLFVPVAVILMLAIPTELHDKSRSVKKSSPKF